MSESTATESNPQPLHGSCLCGGVRYTVAGTLGAIVYCHCQQCRKAQGGAHGVNAPIASAAFQLLSGAELLQAYESSPGKRRVFCSRCGSPIYSQRSDRPETLRLRIGTLDTPITTRPQAHIYAASKAEWDEIHDALPRHAATEPERR